MRNKLVANWWIDAMLLVGFLVSFYLDLTGLSLHQWLGVAIGVMAGVHLLIHWNWVKSVTPRLFGRTSAQARVNYWLDASLLLSLSLILLTGLVISTWLALPLGNYDLWKNLHIIVSGLTLLVVVLKIGVHRRWIINVAERYIFAPQTPKPVKPPTQPVNSPINTERREFLSLVGLVSVAALLSFVNVLIPDQDAGASSSSDNQGSFDTQQSSSLSGSTDPCMVLCNRGCSAPGHCRRYTDTNSNNRCDLGECI
jgi:hypothetical protein